jgi:hypothetical protein
MKNWAWLSFTACGIGLFLSGCGGGTVPAATPVAPEASPLAGNWLIVGPMPTIGFTAPGTGVFSLAMTFDVNGNNITASGYGSGFCKSNSSPPVFNSAFSFGSLSSGAVAADGSFSLQTPQNVPVTSLSMQGRVPEANAGHFAGTYSASFNSTAGPGCVGESAGMFTATPFPLVNGLYNGTGTFQTLTNGPSTATPITIQVKLQQGAQVFDPATGTSKASNIAVGGIVRVEGFPCFTSGTANTTLFAPIAGPLSSIEGNILTVRFNMDDGSTLTLAGALTDSTENHISAQLLVAPSAKCGPGFSSFSSIDFSPIDLIRQS